MVQAYKPRPHLRHELSTNQVDQAPDIVFKNLPLIGHVQRTIETQDIIHELT